MMLISACLVGINCKYNGKNNYNEKALDLVKKGIAIPICPEQLGGLTTPRNPSEIRIIDNKVHVIDNKNNDVTKEFEKGAYEVLKLTKDLKVDKVILKSKSPSCGIGKIYDGTFSNNLIDGNGILANLLIDNNIEVVDIEDIK